MAKYLAQVKYTNEGLKGLLKEGGSSRREVTEKMIAAIGGKVESFYYAFGETDAFVIFDVPDNITATALSLTVNAAGAVTVVLTSLMLPEEVDSAAKITVPYRPAGQ